MSEYRHDESPAPQRTTPPPSDGVDGDATRLADTEQAPARSSAPRRIGPYRLVRLVGEGGMGEVWEAEQREPLERRVAVKLVKLGMESRQVVARFESERQALAVMEHPCIARVIDGGATAGRRPYFVMEYVEGVPLDQYCDERRLTLRRRLEIFLDNLARLHLIRGRPAEAEKIFREVAAVRARVLGPDHDLTLTSRLNLGIAASDAGDLDLAVVELRADSRFAALVERVRAAAP